MLICSRYQLYRVASTFFLTLITLILISVPQPTESGGFFEVGEVTLSNTVDNGVWATVAFQKSYINPVVIAGPVTHANDLSLSVRIRNVSATSFQIGIQSPCENAGGAAGGVVCPPAGGWLSETVQYWVIEEGAWVFRDGQELEAALHNTNTVRAGIGGAANNSDPMTYVHTYPSAPAVFHQVITWNDSDWITTTVWGPSGGRGSPPSNVGFRMALEGAEVTSSHGAESIAWAAVERGTGSNAGNTYDVGRTAGRSVDRHSDGCFNIGSFAFPATPNVVSQHNSMNGGNGGWVRLCLTGIDTTRIRGHLDEDQVRDAERTGIPEYATWFAYTSGGFGNLLFSTSTMTVVDDNGGLVQPGDTLTYSLQITNQQNDYAQPDNAAPELVDYLPAYTSLVMGSENASSGALTYNAGLDRMECNGAIPAGGGVTLSYQVRLASAANCRTISNQARVWMDPNGDGSNSVDELSDDPGLDDGIDQDLDSFTWDDDPTSIQVECTISDPTLPPTGFAPDQVTSIPKQPLMMQYEVYGALDLLIPRLGIETSIVGVPIAERGWDVTWLWNQVGYLEGTAFPTWRGNTALSAHNVLPNGLPGPFAGIRQLKWGDEVVIRTSGLDYIYSVREVFQTHPDDSSALRHEDYDWVTLITCSSFDEESGEYSNRSIVRAILLSVKPSFHH